MSDAQLPGRLGNPESTLATDPRTDPRLLPALELAELAPGVDPPERGASYEEALEYCAAFEAINAEINEPLRAALPTFEGVESSTQEIEGPDGNKVPLYIHRPKETSGPVPCIVHTHGGGMVLMTAQDPGFILWRDSLAAAGLVVVGVEFRNGGGKLGNHPFPAGLSDCAAAARWVTERREELGISSIVISGESGGGNLSIATTLKAKQDGWGDQIQGVYACCPYISGTYGEPPAELASLHENEGYMLECQTMDALVKVYDPAGENATNPLAWPLHATPEDLEGLPPHVISVNELDPLRDEGLAFYRKLAAAGVPVSARTVNGTPHAGDLMFPEVLPQAFEETLRSVVAFAHSV